MVPNHSLDSSLEVVESVTPVKLALSIDRMALEADGAWASIDRLLESNDSSDWHRMRARIALRRDLAVWRKQHFATRPDWKMRVSDGVFCHVRQSMGGC